MATAPATATTREDRDLLARIEKRLAREHLADFIVYASHGRWERAPHLDLLCAKLEGVESGKIKRLMVLIPHRYSKSETASRFFPAWFLGRNPEREVLLTSYGAELAKDLSRVARGVLQEMGPRLWGVHVSSESHAADRWDIRGHRGRMVAAGADGPVGGRGADPAIIDDPYKSSAEARSRTVRDHIWDWYQRDLRPRLAPGAAIVLVMSRLHWDDLAGRLLREQAKGGEQWEVLRLPCIAEADDPLGRSPGEVLWPARYDAQEIAAIRRGTSQMGWQAQYQQDPPKDLEAALWTYDAVEDERLGKAPDLDRIVVAVDPAVTGKAGSDETGISVCGRDGQELPHGYVLADFSLRTSSPLTWARRAVNAYHDFEADLIAGEVNNGGDLVEATIRSIDPNVPYKAVRASRGKAIRAEPIAAFYESGRVHHVGMFDALERQLAAMTTDGYKPEEGAESKSPDRADAMVYALTELLLDPDPEPRIRRL